MKIAVMGLGLIGASLAKALSGHAEVVGINRNQETVARALAEGVITRGGNDPALAAGCDMAVIALPVGMTADAGLSLIPHLDQGAVLTDAGSTKADIVMRLEKSWPWFVGSHPIAGKENPGYASSEADLFQDRPCIITPGGNTKSECIKKTRRLWESVGARVTLMDPLLHDELMAKISHMPHLLSFASMGIARDLHFHRDLLGAGFRDFTRIAASDPVMWRDIFLANRTHILKLIDDYIGELEAMKGLIETDQPTRLEELLRSYSTIRRDLYENKG